MKYFRTHYNVIFRVIFFILQSQILYKNDLRVVGLESVTDLLSVRVDPLICVTEPLPSIYSYSV
jgi:hypothetical protein